MGFCAVCSLNFVGELKNHLYTNAHINFLEKFLEKEQSITKGLCVEMKQPKVFTQLNLDEQMKNGRLYWCTICECDVDDKEQEYHKFALFRHMAGKKHEKNVEKILNTYVKTKGLSKRFKKKHFKITKGAFDKYKERIEELKSTPKDNPVEKEEIIEEKKEEILINEPVTKAVPCNIAPWHVNITNTVNVRKEIIDLVAAANAISLTRKNKNPKRHRRPIHLPSTKKRVLPNYGSVWQSGPRSQTAIDFLESKNKDEM